MPVKRRRYKGRPYRIAKDAIEAWKAGDVVALYRALDMHPAMPSPLPLNLEPLGCDQRTKEEDAAMPYANRLWNDFWPEVQAIQRELYRVAGEPGRAD